MLLLERPFKSSLLFARRPGSYFYSRNGLSTDILRHPQAQARRTGMTPTPWAHRRLWLEAGPALELLPRLLRQQTSSLHRLKTPKRSLLGNTSIRSCLSGLPGHSAGECQ
jgi:hypothetical protein